MPWGLFIVLGFLSGSVPYAWLIGRARGVDIRRHGSGNPGATNVGRVLGSRWGHLCLALDIAKGLVPTLAAGWAAGVLGDRTLDARSASLWLGVAIACVLGHMFSPFLGFRGGKGVATGLGGVLGVFPALTVPAGVAAGVWLVSTRLTRYVGASSCLAAVAIPVATRLWARGEGRLVLVAGTAVLAVLVIWKHRGNLRRTLAGTEPRIGDRAGAREPAAERDRTGAGTGPDSADI